MTALPPPLAPTDHPARYIVRHYRGQSLILDTLWNHRVAHQLEIGGNLTKKRAHTKARQLADRLNTEHQAWLESEGDT